MYTMRKSGISVMLAAFWLCASGSLPAQTVTTLHSFDVTDGELPIGGLVQATDGNFYGTTVEGGINVCKVDRTHSNPNGVNKGCGTIFRITPSGALTSLHSFDGKDGEYPESGVMQGIDGNFYGTTQAGGTGTGCTGEIPGCGTIFKITPSGAFTSLHSFQLTDGATPARKLVQGTDGNFYGATGAGGANGDGTVFKITPSGTLTTLHSFDGADGADLYVGLVQSADGNFYGTTGAGGANGNGTVFKITPSGTLTTLHSFDGTDGSEPNALVQGSNGNFYGTTIGGGTGGNADNAPSGTVFEITPSGTLTTLFNFDNLNNQNPGDPLVGALVQGTGTDGNFYGLTVEGGSGSACGTAGCGTLYKITPSGTLTVVYSIPGPPVNGIPDAGLTQGTNGSFYGATNGGGLDYGTIYSLSLGLGPFVETQPGSGVVGSAVNILGTDLTGATSVTFNRTAAKFTVVSSSEITTAVPAGATTGTVEVVTPSGTLSSNVSFQVP
jgi:uncharacterized repeat protein (TIGR03803 family)